MSGRNYLEEGKEDAKKAREGKCEITFGNRESWLITKCQRLSKVQRLLSLIFRYYQGRNYALQSKDSHYYKRNTKLEFTESQSNSP